LQSFVGSLEVVSEDKRRIIKESSDNKSFSVQHFVVSADSLPLGNHYHPEGKTETFVILKGGGKVLIYPVNQNGEKIGDVVEHRLQAMTVIHIPPYNVHTFYLTPGSEMVCASSREFRPEDLCSAPEKL
jgi:oxalate decarboxylase/phosphoglucose isomerase-like protein (cupin superfamily)